MTTLDRRHRGRAIRSNRRRAPGTSLAFVTIVPDLTAFTRAMESVARELSARSRTYRHPRQIIHNGRKPR